MKRVQFFTPSQTYLQKVEALFEEHRKRILDLVPTALVEHIGATSVPGLLTKGLVVQKTIFLIRKRDNFRKFNSPI